MAMMTVHTQIALRKKHRKELREIEDMLKESATINLDALKQRTGWCHTKAENAMRVADMLSIIKPV